MGYAIVLVMNTAQTIIAKYNGKWFADDMHLDNYCADRAKVAIHKGNEITFTFSDESCILSEPGGYKEIVDK